MIIVLLTTCLMNPETAASFTHDHLTKYFLQGLRFHSYIVGAPLLSLKAS